MDGNKTQAMVMMVIGLLLVSILGFGVFIFNAGGNIPIVLSILVGIILLAVMGGIFTLRGQFTQGQTHEKAKRSDGNINMYNLIDDLIASSTQDERRYLQDRVNRRRKAANVQTLEMMLDEHEAERHSHRR